MKKRKEAQIKNTLKQEDNVETKRQTMRQIKLKYIHDNFSFHENGFNKELRLGSYIKHIGIIGSYPFLLQMRFNPLDSRDQLEAIIFCYN